LVPRLLYTEVADASLGNLARLVDLARMLPIWSDTFLLVNLKNLSMIRIFSLWRQKLDFTC
jgi:hypothetical protein